MSIIKNNEKIPINCINYYADRAGCGWYRMSFPAMALETLLQGKISFKFLETKLPILDKNYYLSNGRTRVIRLQRWHTPEEANVIKNFLRPIADTIGMWLVYEIDDVLTYEDIPDYNIAKPFFSPELIGNSVKEIMDCCDIITVTTEELKNLYVTKLQQDPKKILVIPNYLPRWWIGDSFNIDTQLKQYDMQRNRPHIGFCCSTNHFDAENRNNGVDDFTEIMPWIKKNLNRFLFNFVGGIPQQLIEDARNGKIYAQPPSDIFNYARELKLRQLDLLIAPLIDSQFNRCKSNIKWLECSALGIPMIGQDICTYNKYTNQVFKNTDQVEEWVDKLFFRKDSRDFYADLIIRNRALVEGTGKDSGWWLERNIQKYYDLYSLPQNYVSFNF